MATMPLLKEVEYPESDGRPMAETQVHLKVMVDLLNVLELRFAGVPDVYVSGNMCFYYEEGRPASFLAPDVFVVHGLDKEVRRTYKLWEEGRVPSLIVEITSKSIRDEDLNLKKGVYARLGVAEYVLFDPLEEYLQPSLQGFRWSGGRYLPIAPEPDGSLASRTTGLTLTPEGQRLRLRDAATGEPLLWNEEHAAAQVAAEALADQQTRRAEDEKRAREAAEERNRFLEAELARLRRLP